jgi:hypothetical protein
VDVAATLELRGYARGAPRSVGIERRSRHDRRFVSAGVGIAAAGLAGTIAGIAGFDPYPSIVMDAGLPTVALAAAIPLVAALPFASARLSRGPKRRARIRHV